MKEFPTLLPGELGLYGRTSGEDQKDNETIATQVEYGRNYSLTRRLPEPVLYLDEGVSGTVPLEDRTDGRRLLADAKAGTLKVLLLYRLNRLGRDPEPTMQAIGRLTAFGVTVISMTESFDLADEAGRLMARILAAFGGYERETNLKHSYLGRKRCARAGGWAGGPAPLGYRLEGRKSRARLVFQHEQIAGLNLSPYDLVGLIFQLAVEGLSCERIAGHLNAMGVPNITRITGSRRKSEGDWKPGAVHWVLTNPTYLGTQRWGESTWAKHHPRADREVVEIEWPARIDEATWEAVQATLAANKKFSRRNSRREYLLRGLIRCGNCESPYSGTCRPNGETYYLCRRLSNPKRRERYQENPPEVPCLWIPAAELEAEVWAKIEDCARHPKSVLAELAARHGDDEARVKTLQTEVSRLMRDLDAKTQDRTWVVTQWRRGPENGGISEAEAAAQRAVIDREEAALRKQIQERQALLARIAQNQAGLARVEQMLKTLREKLDRGSEGTACRTFAEKREAVETIVREVVVTTILIDGRRVAEPEVVLRFDEEDGSIASRSDLSSCCNRTLELTRPLLLKHTEKAKAA